MVRQFVKFGIVGAFNSIINYMIYIWCIEMGMHYILANVVGFVITIFCAYILQSKFVFQVNNDTQWWKMLIKTYISYAFTGLVLANLLSILWIDVLSLENVLSPFYQFVQRYFTFRDINTFIKWLAPIMSMIVIIPLNFLINKFWTYGKK